MIISSASLQLLFPAIMNKGILDMKFDIVIL